MIELPEAHVLAAQMNNDLTGKVVSQVVAAHSPHGFAFYNGDPKNYDAMLKGKTIMGARAYGGRVELELDDMRLSFFDGVNIRFLKNVSAPPPKHQLLIAFTDKTGFYCTISMYGGMLAFPEGADLGFYDRVSRDKPSPLTDEFDESYFNTLLDESSLKLSAKAFLATGQRIPGLGNGVLQDILWECRLSPKRKMATVSQGEYHTLFVTLKTVLKTMTDLGGRDTEKDFFQQPGGYHTIVSKKNVGMVCPRCGGSIVRSHYLGGNVYLCEKCQS